MKSFSSKHVCTVRPLSQELAPGTTSGIEPFFALAFRRQNVLGGERFEEIEPVVLERAATLGAEAGPLLDAVRRTGRLPSGPESSALPRSVFATSLEIPPEAHLLMQAAFQRHVDNAVSKTINLPAQCKPEDVASIYRQARRLGVKGITVFRQGSRDRQVLHAGGPEQLAAAAQLGVEPLQHAQSELPLAFDGDHPRVRQAVRRVRLEFDALLEVDQVELNLLWAEVKRGVRHQRVEERRLAGAGLAGH